ncbi:flavin-dependent amine oxidoreductase [Kineococcus xinjiangensis]|uniref:Flavin-dependent amine oxidoreductase n=1 Tax=Kineococcus xinjiangensis TaxID=512762 RepID=A0A2S6IMB5_9ACTN|nr:flavin-dependent amine oxidoreductase [Kineococcus xinjiangensis]
MIGAGTAGLACARHLVAEGLHVVVLEAEDTVGGRIRSEEVGGFRLDRGFQVLNPAYPEVRQVLDVPALRLQHFDAGIAVQRAGEVVQVRDPRRHPTAALEALRFPIGTLREKLAAARWALGTESAAALKGPDTGWRESLDAAGVTGELRTAVVEPFLAGVIGEAAGTTSARFVNLLVRSFLRATPGLPAAGMGAVTAQLAAFLPPGTVVTGARAEHQFRGPRELLVQTTAGGVATRAVVVATDPVNAAHLTGLPEPEMHPLTTFWFAAPSSPAPPSRAKLIHVDGDRNGPVITSAVVSEVAPSYALQRFDERALVSALVLGDRGDTLVQQDVRAHLSRIYRTGTRDWELLAVHALPHALPALGAPFTGPQPVALGDSVYVCGDHRDNASQQGALVSGRRAALAVLRDLGVLPARAR